MKFIIPGLAALCLAVLPLHAQQRSPLTDLPTDGAPLRVANPEDYRAKAAAYVDSHVEGKVRGTMWAIFGPGDFNTGVGWQRNRGLWCADLDLTCLSPWNSTQHNLQAGTLITKKHVLLAYHFSNPQTGTPPMVRGETKMQFVSKDNTIYTRTLTAFKRVADTDILIGTLDADLPDAITPAKIFAVDKGKGILPGTPLIYSNQDKQACVGECVVGGGPNIVLRPVPGGKRAEFTTPGPARVGDSGAPIFLPLDGRAVLVAHFFFANGGPSTGYYLPGINAITGRNYPVVGVVAAPMGRGKTLAVRALLDPANALTGLSPWQPDQPIR